MIKLQKYIVLSISTISSAVSTISHGVQRGRANCIRVRFVLIFIKKDMFPVVSDVLPSNEFGFNEVLKRLSKNEKGFKTPIKPKMLRGLCLFLQDEEFSV